MKVTIECPDGYKLEKTKDGYKLVPSSITDKIKSFTDACMQLKITPYEGVQRGTDESTVFVNQLRTIVDALNEGYQFDLFKDSVYFPIVYVDVYTSGDKVVGKFRYKDKVYGIYDSYSYNSCGVLDYSDDYRTSQNISIDMTLACKSEEIATYVATKFGRLLFMASCSNYLKDIEWLD